MAVHKDHALRGAHLKDAFMDAAGKRKDKLYPRQVPRMRDGE